jgi:arylsulfatase A-like enzyme
MSERQLRKIIALAGAAVLLLASAAAVARSPNLIIIMTDNQSPSLLGTYGSPGIRTPHIDRLAREGLRFDRAFATSGVCSPTRATLLTGLLPSQHGVHNALPVRGQRQAEAMPASWSAVQEFRTLPRTLADAGYATGLVGKFHLGTHDVPQLGFDYWVTFPSGHTMDFYGTEIYDNGRVYREQGHMTELWTNKAIEFLSQQNRERPFFLFLSYNGPYMLPPVVLKEPKNRHVDYYRKNTPAMPQHPVHPNLINLASQFKPSPMMFRIGFGGWPQISALNNRDAMINLASEMSTVDDGVGRVMAALGKAGLDEDTLVVFMSDQGSLYGQHGLWGNSSAWWPYTTFEENMRIPLIFRRPGHVPAAQTTDAMVNQTDFLPTVLEYLNLEDRKIANGSGRSYSGLLRGRPAPAIERDEFVIYEYITVRVIRTPRWKYQKAFLAGKNTLYDLKADPGETKNLVDDPEYAAVVANLGDRLDAFFARYTDRRYDLWQGGTAKLKLMDAENDQLFAEKFPGWTPPVVGFDRSVFSD